MISSENVKDTAGRKSRLRGFLNSANRNHRGKSGVSDSNNNVFGSNTSLGGNPVTRHPEVLVPHELSLEEVSSKDGAIQTFLRVYCEHIRQGDHFKTIKVFNNSTIDKCIKDLVHNYYSKFGNPEDFELYEVIGSISSYGSSPGSGEAILGFTETQARVVSKKDTVQAFFSRTGPKYGNARRIELRRRVNTAAIPPSPAINTRRGSVPTSESLGAPLTPLVRRAITPGGARLTLRDSRRQRLPRGSRPPNGPYMLLLRGSLPAKDGLLHDLTGLISTDDQIPEITIGTKPSVDIRIYPPPGDYSGNHTLTYAKLVGHDQPLTTTGSTILSGAIYLEPSGYDTDTLENNTNEQFPTITINDKVINHPRSPHFKSRLLRPGDFLHFGSTKRGYVFLFKDPRWIPEHRLELGFNNPLSSPLDSPPNLDQNGRKTPTNSDRSSDTDSVYSNREFGDMTNGRSTTVVNGRRTIQSNRSEEFIPRSASLRQVISELFIKPSSNSVHTNGSVRKGKTLDPFEAPLSNWIHQDPWRSASLFAHLVRVTAGFIVHPNPPVPNRDVEEHTKKAINDYATNLIKDMHALLFECHQNVISKGGDCVYPNLWLSLFCYDVAILLAPKWLEAVTWQVGSTKPSQYAIADEHGSSGSSTNSGRFTRVVEALPVVISVSDLAYRLADDSVKNTTKVAFEELSPYINSVYNDEDSSDSGFAQHQSLLGDRLERLRNCFASTFTIPTGSAEMRTMEYNDSSPYQTNSTDSSPYATDIFSPERNRMQKQQSKFRFGDASDHGVSTGTDSESNEAWNRADRESSKRIQEAVARSDLATETRIEANVWRQLMATLSHSLLLTLLNTVNIPIDWNTGERLLSDINWLQDWLAAKHLESHRRPLTMIMEFANLLATPRDQLLRMNWTGMRSIYPQVPPAMLKFMLIEYAVDKEQRPSTAWEIDAHDRDEANEEPFQVISSIMDSWYSKESVQYYKINNRSSPANRPRDPWFVYTMPSTKERMIQLDDYLRVILPHADIMRIHNPMGTNSAISQQFPPPKVIRSGQENETKIYSRPNSRARQAPSRRHRSIGDRRMENDTSPPIEPNGRLMKRNGFSTPQLNSPYASNRNTLDRNGTNNRFYTELPDSMRPMQSMKEPQLVKRSFGNEAEQPDDLRTSQQNAMFHFNRFIQSLSQADFRRMQLDEQNQYQHPQHLQPRSQRPSTALAGSPRHDNYGLPSRYGGNPLYESQPNMRALYDNAPQPAYNRYESPDRVINHSPSVGPGYPKSQSMLHLSGDFEDHRTNNNNTNTHRFPRETNPQELLNVSKDYEGFRNTMLGRGIDKYRSNGTNSPMISARNPLHSQVGGSLGNLNSFNPNAVSGMVPTVIVEEAHNSGSSSDSFVDSVSSELHRNGELSDVVTRAGQHSNIVNVTLNSTPNAGFGMVLVDGERTSLDQPGVFVKSMTNQGPALENGEIKFGDRILAINGRDLTGMTYSEALKLLRACNTQATFTIRRCDLPDPYLLRVFKINPLPTNR